MPAKNKKFKLPKREEIWVSSSGQGDRSLKNTIFLDLQILYKSDPRLKCLGIPLNFIIDHKKEIHALLGMLIDSEKDE